LSKNIVVVLKADKDIGTGHLMRVKGIIRHFSQDNLYLVSDSLAKELYPLCSEYKKIVVTEKENLASECLKFKPDLVLEDHYFLDENFEKDIYPFTKVAIIDDLCEVKHQCHLLFGQALSRNAESYKGKVPVDCRLCVGKSVNYIKECFSQIKKVPCNEKNRVLVNFGGADPVHGCLMCAKAIVESKLYLEYHFTFISGMSNPDHDKLKELLSPVKEITLYHHCENITDIFANTDLAIGACGGMFNERVIASIPSINAEIADNQAGVGNLVRGAKIGLVFKVSELSDAAKLKAGLDELRTHFDEYANNCKNVYDPNGLLNVVTAIKELLDQCN